MKSPSTGVEPMTLWLTATRSYQLSYKGKKKCAKQDSNLRILRYVGLSDAT